MCMNKFFIKETLKNSRLELKSSYFLFLCKISDCTSFLEDLFMSHFRYV
jgi:hypothetical protein